MAATQTCPVCGIMTLGMTETQIERHLLDHQQKLRSSPVFAQDPSKGSRGGEQGSCAGLHLIVSDVVPEGTMLLVRVVPGPKLELVGKVEGL